MIAALVALALGTAAVQSCGAQPGTEALFASGKPRIIWVGEGHGTQEQPRAFLTLVCLAERTGRPVVVALERIQEEQPLWDAFLASDGGPEAQAALLKGAGWTSPTQDGRSSQAMAALAEQLRREHAAGRIRRVKLIIPESPGELGPAQHEAAMANAVRAAAEADPDAWVLAYSGNVHANKADVAFPGASYRPAASTLKPDEVTSVLLFTDGGSTWDCESGGCGPHEHPANGHLTPAAIEAGSPWPKFDYTLSLGTLTHASPPAARPAITTELKRSPPTG